MAHPEAPSARPSLRDVSWSGLAGVFGVGVAVNLLVLAVPIYSLQVFDRVLTSRSVDTLVLLTLGVLMALVAMALLDAVRARLLVRIGNRYALALEPTLLRGCLSHAVMSGETSAQPLRDLQTVKGFLGSQQGLTALMDIPLAPAFMVLIYLVHPVLGHATVAGAVLLLGLAVATEVSIERKQRAANELSGRSLERVDVMVQNAEAVVAMGMRANLIGHWQQVRHEALAAASCAADRSGALAASARFARVMLGVVITGVGAYLAIQGEITTGAMIAASILSVRGLAPLELLIGAWRHLVLARAALSRMDAVLSRATRLQDPIAVAVSRGHLQIEQLSYVPHGSSQAVLRGVSVDVPAGTVLGLVGPSGAGKSTLGKMLCGLYAPRAGTVRLDGVDVHGLSSEQVGLLVGYLPQDVQLFEGTVRDNIARFSDADDAAIVHAARLAGAHEMILRLPRGYQTEVGRGGVALAGGQRQRVALARAVFGTPRLIVLDEPTAALDAEGEAALTETIGALKAQRVTVVIISHRPALVACADWVAVLVAGRLERFGAAREVMPGVVRPAAKARLGLTGDGGTNA